MPLLSRALVLVASAGLACFLSSSALLAEGLKVGGTGSATALLRTLGEAFAGGGRVEVVPSLGSSGGLRALGDGVLDLAVVARALKPEEEASGLRTVLRARTPFLFATSQKKPDALTTPDIIAAFSTNTATWSDRNPIKIILRPRAESDMALMTQLFPNLAPAMEKARRRPDVPIAATDQDSADMAEQIPGSLIGISMAQLILEKRDLRPVVIDGVEPTFANFERGTYPHAKTLFFVIRRQPGSMLESFVAFLHSPEGIAALRAAQLM